MIYFISFIYGVSLFYAYQFFPLISIFASMVLIAIFAYYQRKKISAYYLLPIIILVVASLGFYHAKLSYDPPLLPSDIAGQTMKVQGVIKSKPAIVGIRAETFSQKVEVKKAVDEYGNLIDLQELRLFSRVALKPATEYLISVRIPRDAFHLNPGGGKGPISGFAVEIEAVAAADIGFFGETRVRLNSFFKDNFSKESAPFLMAIITGERSLIAPETWHAFRVTGLAHLLAISGAHFGLLLVILFGAIKLLVNLLPHNILNKLTIYFTPTQIAAVPCIPFMIGYLGISAMNIPSIRAFIMITLFLIGLLIQRRGYWLNTLLLAAVIIVTLWPDSILELSFHLSFVAVLCIGIALSSITDGAVELKDSLNLKEKRGTADSLFHRFTAMLRRYCITSATITIAATIGTAPLIAYHFNYFSVVSLFANLVFVPIIGFVILPLTFIASFVFLVSGIFPLRPLIDGIASFVLAALKYIAQWDFVAVGVPAFPSILLLMFYFGLLLYVVINMGIIEPGYRSGEGVNASKIWDIIAKPSVYKLLLPLSIAIIPFLIYTGIKTFEQSGIRITYLDVGQGNAAVIELPDDRTLIMDTGRNGFQVSRFLSHRGIEKIDAIVLSHGSLDHAGGIWSLVRDFEVHEVWDNNRLVYPKEFLRIIKQRGLERGDLISGNGYRITILHPYDGFYTLYSGGIENNDSLVVRIEGTKNSFLFTGDIEREAEEDLLRLGMHLKSNVLKVPHHGSRTSSSEAFISTVSPEIAVISAGRNNIHGHPHNETVATLASAGTRVYRTDRDGAIGIAELSDGTLQVKTWREFQMVQADSIKDEWMNLKRLFWVW